MPYNSSTNKTNFQFFDQTLNSSTYLPSSETSISPPDLSSYTANSSSLLFIDASVSNYESLLAGVAPLTEVHVLNPVKDAVAQITDILLGRQDISSLQIISHGNVGSLDFASSFLNINNIRSYTTELQTWGKALTADADILLYGCNVAAGENGANFIQQLSLLTGADVAASNDLTGDSNKGGNWVLETSTGLIESSALQLEAMANYDFVLDSPVAIINEFSQGSTGAKEWVEILVVQDDFNLQNYRLVDGSNSNSLNIQLSGAGFNGLKAGTLIVLYNGGDIDSAVTPDLNYDPTKGDYSLQISSLNSTGNFAVTRNNGWGQGTGEAFNNDSGTDVPRLLDVTGNEIYKFPKAQTPAGFQLLSVSPLRALPGRATAFIGDTAIGATQATNWSADYYSAAGNPGLANGDKNTAWINSLRGNISPTFNNSTNLTLPSIYEDAPLTDNKGVFISDLIKGQTSDINNNIQGIAVTDVIGSGNWQYSLDGGGNWSSFGKVSDTSATVLTGLVSLYNGAVSNTTPENQSWLQYAASPPIQGLAIGGTQIVNSGATNLTTTQSGSAGYSNYSGGFPNLLNPAFPTLDRNQGFTLSFDVKINSETHASDNTRAGFSVILVTSDKTKAIELGFWQDRIFSQNPTFTGSTESVVRNTTALTRYDLKVQGDRYELFAPGETTPILTGLLRDYTAFDHTTAGSFSTPLPYDPYEQANFVFLGDNTSRASANINLARVELLTNTKIRFAPSPNTDGNAAIEFRAWDGADGATTGTGVNTTSSNAFSSAAKMASITVIPTAEWQIVAVDNFISASKQSILQRNETGAYRVVNLNYDSIPQTITLPTMSSLWQIASIADFTGDKIKDIFWRNSTTGENEIWRMSVNGAQVVNLPTIDPNNVTIQYIGDFEGDGDADILLRDSSNGEIKIWEANPTNPNLIREVVLASVADNNIQIKQVSDLDADGDLDIFWHNDKTGYTAIWQMTGTNLSLGVQLPTVSDTNTKIQLIADFDNDTDMDILWYDGTTGLTALWEMDRINLKQGIVLGYVSDTDIKIKHIADFDGDKDLDILWYNDKTGYTAIWEIDGVNLKKGIVLASAIDTNTKIERIADFDGDGDLDILWYNALTGLTASWQMNGVNLQQGITLSYVSDTNTKIKSIANFDGVSDLDIFWHNETTGFTTIWNMNGTNLQQGFVLPKIDVDFKVNAVGDLNGDGKPDIVWHNSSNSVAKIWLIDGTSVLGEEILMPI
ncbi:putative Ig [Calothrix sp. NIES-4071]|nr:putative Ig [Calothrix sp. NIES-4071]BAZ57042.1 putative Ig [Calothrix sp. NIES-4105]